MPAALGYIVLQGFCQMLPWGDFPGAHRPLGRFFVEEFALTVLPIARVGNKTSGRPRRKREERPRAQTSSCNPGYYDDGTG